ncbi:hypothetical protein BJ165DRAFT_1535436 [Panaeolus papilionaceus]|nr:hypothetical protein BJ165DRAFT_1535436 [Panaeolus papilionaceus]
MAPFRSPGRSFGQNHHPYGQRPPPISPRGPRAPSVYEKEPYNIPAFAHPYLQKISGPLFVLNQEKRIPGQLTTARLTTAAEVHEICQANDVLRTNNIPKYIPLSYEVFATWFNKGAEEFGSPIRFCIIERATSVIQHRDAERPKWNHFGIQKEHLGNGISPQSIDHNPIRRKLVTNLLWDHTEATYGHVGHFGGPPNMFGAPPNYHHQSQSVYDPDLEGYHVHDTPTHVPYQYKPPRESESSASGSSSGSGSYTYVPPPSDHLPPSATPATPGVVPTVTNVATTTNNATSASYADVVSSSKTSATRGRASRAKEKQRATDEVIDGTGDTPS